MNPDQFEALFLKGGDAIARFKRWWHLTGATHALCWFLGFSVIFFAYAVGAAPKRTEVPQICKNIDGKDVCLVSKANLELLITEHDKLVDELKKIRRDCSKLNES